MNENEIIKKILTGEKELFKELTDKYAQKIFAYLYRFLGNDKNNALDLNQVVFIKAYEKLALFNHKKSFSPWIYRIAHNEAVNFIKKNSRKNEVLIDEEHWDDVKADTESVTTQIDKKAAAKKMEEALNQLKSHFKEVLVLHYFEDKSYEEIAEILNKPRNTIGILILRGKEHLAKILKI